MQAAGPLERSGELEILESAVAGAADGAGRLVVVEGPAGIGKSRLLDEAAESARFLGARTLRAQATAAARETTFGVARSLLGPAVTQAEEDERAALLDGAAGLATQVVERHLPAHTANDFALIHGLHALTARLAERRPLLLLVDDLHWADEPSLRFCAYLAQRVSALPVTLVLAARPVDRDDDPAAEVLATLAALPSTQTLRPRALSAGAVGRLVEGVLAEPAAPEFVAACARLTGGNPFLVGALLEAATTQGLTPAAHAAPALDDLLPTGVRRSVAARLEALTHAEVDLAHAVSVLGDAAALPHAAALAGLDLDAAVRAADRLAVADLLRPGAPGAPLGFRHPLAAAAVAAEVPSAVRGAAHLRAAQLLHADGAPAERLAEHLVPVPPGGRDWVVATLREAARHALDAGVPGRAVEHLRRALAEPPADADHGPVLVELGRAEAAAGVPTAQERLLRAVALVTEPEDRAQTLRELARARVATGDHAGGRAAYSEALRALDDAEGAAPALVEQLRAEERIVAALDPARRPDAATVGSILADARAAATPAGRALLATLARRELHAGAPRDRTLALADQALGGGALLHDEGARQAVHGIVRVLLAGDELGRAEDLLERLAGLPNVDRVALSAARAWAHLVGGRVRAALTDAREAVDVGHGSGDPGLLAEAYGVLVTALLEAGEEPDAERRLAEASELLDPAAPPLLAARGLVHAMRGRHGEAAADLLAVGEAGPTVHAVLPPPAWRAPAGLALARAGEAARARELLVAGLAAARGTGVPRDVAIALRATGAVVGGSRGLALIGEAVTVLEGSPAGLERMRTLAEHGAALRRAGRRTDAAAVLEQAVALARAGGAGAIERRAAEELAVAGARGAGASQARRGSSALSPSELRVTQLAASGMTNREIAEALFVTRKAVEWHLSNAYAKLGIASRKELPGALPATDG